MEEKFECFTIHRCCLREREEKMRREADTTNPLFFFPFVRVQCVNWRHTRGCNQLLVSAHEGHDDEELLSPNIRSHNSDHFPAIPMSDRDFYAELI